MIKVSLDHAPLWWRVLNISAFQLCWFSLLIMGDLAVPWVIAWLLGHYSLSPCPKSDRLLMIWLLVLGALFEALHFHMQWLVLPNHYGPLPPLWLVCFWPLLATLFLHSLSWLWYWPWLGGLLLVSLVCGSYQVGTHLLQGQLTTTGASWILLEWSFVYYLSYRYIVPMALALITSSKPIKKSRR